MSYKTSANDPLPDHLKNMTQEQFLAGRKPGEFVSQIDLHQILYQAGSNTSSVNDFLNYVSSYLDKVLGINNYVSVISVVTPGTSGDGGPHGNKLTNVAFWGGCENTLPGSVAAYSVACAVFQS